VWALPATNNSKFRSLLEMLSSSRVLLAFSEVCINDDVIRRIIKSLHRHPEGGQRKFRPNYARSGSNLKNFKVKRPLFKVSKVGLAEYCVGGLRQATGLASGQHYEKFPCTNSQIIA
jgi:hypothetical protein